MNVLPSVVQSIIFFNGRRGMASPTGRRGNIMSNETRKKIHDYLAATLVVVGGIEMLPVLGAVAKVATGKIFTSDNMSLLVGILTICFGIGFYAIVNSAKRSEKKPREGKGTN